MKHFIPKPAGFVMVLMCFTAMPVFAQDTVRISLPEAEKQFLQKNLSLLAEKYNIDITRAAVVQARLYNNPTLALSGNLYDPKNNRVFNVSNTSGQYDIAIQQLIRMAGKRNKEIMLAETNTKLSENRFFDLLRTLRYSLRSNFYELCYLQRSLAAYQEQISSLEKMSNAYDVLQAKGVVTLKDAVRIRSLLYSLLAERTELQNQESDLQASLQLLLQNNKAWFIADAAKDDITSQQLQQLNLQQLIDTAYANRYDLLLAQNNLLYSNQNYRLQKALAKPDITLGGEFDKRGSFVDNASFLTVGIDLPFFHRNQGNIKAAKISIDQSKVQLNLQQQTVENDVQKAYTKLLNTAKMLQAIDPHFYEQFEHLLQGVTENFQKKNISLIEFTDFYESYKKNILQFNQLQNQQAQAFEALQFAVGKTIF